LQSLIPHSKIFVYFFVVKGSVEDQKYRSTIKKEREAFSNLVKEKAQIPFRKQIFSPRVDLKETIIVDSREFRSRLPQILYGNMVDIIPCVLDVGDYILTPDICVERKVSYHILQ
jgi:DNA excision repair protein ERCC-4